MPNRGQFAPAVSFAAQGSNYSISLAGTEATLRLRAGSASMKFIGGKADAQSQAMDPQPARSNYLIGNDPSKWRTGVPHFSRVRYSDIYPGIDLIYYGTERKLEYDLVVSPHADPGRIGIKFEDVRRVGIAANGDLTLTLAESELRLLKPDVYQQIDGVRRQIAGDYVLHSGNRVGFRIGPYDHRFPLDHRSGPRLRHLFGWDRGRRSRMQWQRTQTVIPMWPAIPAPRIFRRLPIPELTRLPTREERQMHLWRNTVPRAH